MSVKFISPGELGAEIANAVKEYTEYVTKGIEKEVNATAKLILADTKALAPKKYGTYEGGFAIKKERRQGEVVNTIYNKKRPGLVHLLEFGHAVSNQYGKTSGRADARPHLVPAYNKHADTMVRKIEGIIKRGG